MIANVFGLLAIVFKFKIYHFKAMKIFESDPLLVFQVFAIEEHKIFSAIPFYDFQKLTFLYYLRRLTFRSKLFYTLQELNRIKAPRKKFFIKSESF